jgi:flagellar hook-basal body complex protein FliE
MSQINRIGSEVFLPEIKDAKGASSPAGSFADALSQAIEAVDGAQVNADQEATRLAAGAGNLHETALALEKADLTMRVATKVRNRLVDAYQEVMRMSI